jgi:hypothetical protein
VANSFGQGVTGKAVSERFLRIKKEEPWNLSINREAGGGASTPRKKTPKKGSIKNEDNVDDEEEFETPSKKKTPLNKVQNGRVTKKKTGSAASSFIKGEDVEILNQSSGDNLETPADYNMEGFDQGQVQDNAEFFHGVGDDDEA